MHNSKIFRRVFVLTALLVLSSAIAAGIYTRSSKSQEDLKHYGRAYDPVKVTEIPEVVCPIEGLQIAGITLVNQGTPAAALEIDIINHRDAAVMTLDFVTSTKNDLSGLMYDGLWEEGNPRELIPPHTLKTFTVFLGGMMEGRPITVAIAVFSDGKEVGDPHSLASIKKNRLEDQEKRRAEKAKSGGPQ